MLEKSIIEITSRNVEPKVYAVVFRKEATDHVNQLILFTSLGYSLEDVYENFRRQIPPEETWLPYLWQSISVKNLVKVSGVITREIKEVKEVKEEPLIKAKTEADIKNELMSKIIKDKDTKLFELSKTIFSENEQKFISEKLLAPTNSKKKKNDKGVS